MKRTIAFLLIFIGFVSSLSAQEHRRYALIWHDEFNSGVLDEEVWSKIPRSKAAWAVHMTSDERLYGFEDGNLVLRGMVNDFKPKDKEEVLTGGVWSKYKKNFGFGRIEVRAKFDVAQGYWPAIWMLPQSTKTVNWPYGGEIDIMEHFGESPYVNHTVHSHYTYNLRKRNRPPYVAYPRYNEGQYNTYGMERFQDSLVFSVNGQRTMNYPRYRKGSNDQFPFSQHDYYLILDAQLGNDGSPSIDKTKLPVELRIDYVRYYEVDTKTDVIPEPGSFEPLGTKKFKFKRIVVKKNEQFADPDEYHIIVKRGKATVSGNVVWAESTVNQLIGTENGTVANIEIHDKAACPYRGVSLDKYNKNLSFNELNKILEVMAFYKLNYLQWDGKGSRSEEEATMLKDKARELGITLVTSVSSLPKVDVIDLDTKSQSSSQVFLQTASKNGGWFYLKGMDKDDMEALMAFSERYWRGGGAGEGTVKNGLPEALSTAGTRLANFKEKLVVHRNRFNN